MEPATPVGQKLDFFVSHLQAGFIVKKTDSKGKTRPLVLFCDKETASFVYYRNLEVGDFESLASFSAFVRENFVDGAKNKPVKRNDPLALLDLKSVEPKAGSKLVLHFKNPKYKEYSKSLTISFFKAEDYTYVKNGFDSCVSEKNTFENVEVIKAGKHKLSAAAKLF